MDVKPTGTCFEDVTLFFVQMVRDNRKLRDDPTFAMVHGICHHEDRKPYSHAWIEHGDKVWFSGMLGNTLAFLKTDRTEFYQEFDVTDCTRYTFWQAMRAGAASGDQPPPWELKYRRLCNDYKEE